jgi:hypothetical protein
MCNSCDVVCNSCDVVCNSCDVVCNSCDVVCNSCDVVCNSCDVVCNSCDVVCNSCDVVCNSCDVVCNSCDVVCNSCYVVCNSCDVVCNSCDVVCNSCRMLVMCGLTLWTSNQSEWSLGSASCRDSNSRRKCRSSKCSCQQSTRCALDTFLNVCWPLDGPSCSLAEQVWENPLLPEQPSARWPPRQTTFPSFSTSRRRQAADAHKR